MAEVLSRHRELVGQRLKPSPSVDFLRSQSAQYPQPGDLVRLAHSGNMLTWHYASGDDARSLLIARRSDGWSLWWLRTLGAILLTAVGGLVWWKVHSGGLVAWLCRWPYAVGVLVGLAWWLFASPSLLGWAIVAVSLWGALRLPVRSQPAFQGPTEPSTGTVS